MKRIVVEIEQVIGVALVAVLVSITCACWVYIGTAIRDKDIVLKPQIVFGPIAEPKEEID